MAEFIIPSIFIVGIGLLLFLALRAIMLWYWKVDVIVNHLESVSAKLSFQNEQYRKQIRVAYYSAKASGDNKMAYESLLQIVFDELLKNGLKKEQQQGRYDELKKKYGEVFQKLGYSFPDYDLLFN